MSPREKFKCELLSWESVARDGKRLSEILRNSGYKPDVVVAIGRGGLVPARILCDYLHIKDLTTIKVEHWGITATPDEKAVVKYPLNTNIEDKQVLLVDDITDTGDTLRVSIQYLKTFRPKEIRTAALIHKTTSKFTPDYYIKKIATWRWIIFPWHVWEDLTTFVKKIKAGGIHSVKGLRNELKKKYCLDVSAETIREIVQELPCKN